MFEAENFAEEANEASYDDSHADGSNGQDHRTDDCSEMSEVSHEFDVVEVADPRSKPSCGFLKPGVDRKFRLNLQIKTRTGSSEFAPYLDEAAAPKLASFLFVGLPDQPGPLSAARSLANFDVAPEKSAIDQLLQRINYLKESKNL